MFNKSLIAIGGYTNRKVEVYEGDLWNDRKIESVGNDLYSYLYRLPELTHFTSLSTESHIYVFGNI